MTIYLVTKKEYVATQSDEENIQRATVACENVDETFYENVCSNAYLTKNFKIIKGA